MFAFALLAAGLVVPTALRAQSLADTARRAEEERAKTRQGQAISGDAKNPDGNDKPPAAKVYTNNDLAKRLPPAVAVGHLDECRALLALTERQLAAAKPSLEKSKDCLAVGNDLNEAARLNALLATYWLAGPTQTRNARAEQQKLADQLVVIEERLRAWEALPVCNGTDRSRACWAP
jgi:hypothetical protein